MVRPILYIAMTKGCESLHLMKMAENETATTAIIMAMLLSFCCLCMDKIKTRGYIIVYSTNSDLLLLSSDNYFLSTGITFVMIESYGTPA